VLALGGVCAAQLGPDRPPPPTGAAPAHRAASPAPKPQTPAKPARKPVKGKPVLAEETLPPPRPLTPEQLPPSPAAVTYRNGQLAIVANNSTMSDVLGQVRQQTGAQFEMTGVSPADRVYVKLGPGAPKDVLAALLAGTRFNFAILGSPTDPNAVARVVMMPKSGGVSPPAPAAAMGVRTPMPEAEEIPEEEIPVVEEEPPPPPAEEQPAPQTPQQPGQVKTPEQLLQELQHMQQQQQQQQNPQQQQIPDREIPD